MFSVGCLFSVNAYKQGWILNLFARAAVATKAVEQMLVQPPALVGAMPVREGELYRDGMLYDKDAVTEGESDTEKEEDLILQQNFNATDTFHGLSPGEIIRACNSTCQVRLVAPVVDWFYQSVLLRHIPFEKHPLNSGNPLLNFGPSKLNPRPPLSLCRK